MIEKNFQKKITPYLDGSLSSAERTEFEAMLNTYPKLKQELRYKEVEIEKIRSFIPQVTLDSQTRMTLEHEAKQSVFSLLEQRPKNFWEDLKNRYEEWINR